MIMNIVLAGFSAQNTDALRFFIESQYQNVHCTCYKRSFGLDNLTLILPDIANKKAVDAYIVNLNGIGINSLVSEKQYQQLTYFLQNKPAILFSTAGWNRTGTLPKNILFQKVPYTKQDIQDKLASLFAMVDALPKTVMTNAQQVTGLPPPDIVSSVQNTKNTQYSQDFKEWANTQKNILKIYFNETYQNHTVLEIINALTCIEPFKITIKNESVIINHHANYAIEQNAEGLLSGIYRGQSVDEIIMIEPLNNKELQDLQFFAQQKTYRKHALNTVLWQIYSAVLPKQLVVPDHNLLLKVRMMPNFGNMINIPDHIHAVMAACLVSPKTLGQLQAMFPEFHDRKYKLQRVMVLAILSGLADMTVIESSLNEQTTTQNTSVTKAKKTGFFQRLLSRLSVA